MPYFTEVAAPLARAQTSANLLAAAVPDASADTRWMSGVSWVGELCPNLDILGPCDEVDTVGEPSGGEITYLTPLGYRLRAECSTIGGPKVLEVTRQRLARQVEAVASYAVARELWEGAGADANPFEDPFGNPGVINPYLSDGNADTITSGASLLECVGILEQEARDRTKGQQVFLHIPIRVVTQIGASLLHVGNEIRTHTDAIVVADGGYTGRGPAGDQAGVWGYATGPVFVKLGPAATTDDPAVTIDRRTNVQTIWADRMFMAGYDPCCHLAIKFP